MLIDLTEKFLKLREENKLKEKDAIHDKYLKEYLDLRQSWVSSDNNVCNLFLDKYSDYEFDEDDWSSLIWLCEDVFQYSQLPEKMEMLKEYIKSRIPLLEDVDISDVKDNISEEYHEFLPLLVKVEEQMFEIAQLREFFGIEIKDNAYAFKSKFDTMSSADYLRLSLLEDFLLEQGAFIPMDEEFEE